MAVRNNGLRKICACRKSNWTRCAHAWHFNFKPRNGPPFRFSLDAELGRHIDNKTEADKEATNIRAAILAGTFERASDRRAREQREAEEAAGRATEPTSLTPSQDLRRALPRPAAGRHGRRQWLLGKVTTSYADDWAVTRRSLRSLKTSSKFSQVARDRRPRAYAQPCT